MRRASRRPSGRAAARALVLGVVAALGGGCRTVGDVARDTGARDLKCPQSEVRADLVGQYTNLRHYIASGCGHYVKYTCPEVGKAHYECMPDEPLQVHDIRELDAGVDSRAAAGR